jgi:hypothetical protein
MMARGGKRAMCSQKALMRYTEELLLLHYYYYYILLYVIYSACSGVSCKSYFIAMYDWTPFQPYLWLSVKSYTSAELGLEDS